MPVHLSQGGMIFRIEVEAVLAVGHTSGGHHPLLDTPQQDGSSTTLIPWTYGGTYRPLYLSVGDKVITDSEHRGMMCRKKCRNTY